MAVIMGKETNTLESPITLGIVEYNAKSLSQSSKN
jgi:hypothetical protein